MRHLVLLLLLLLLLLALPLAAQNSEVTLSYGITTARGDDGIPTFGVSYNRFWTRIVSTRAGLFRGQDERTLDDIRRERRFTATYATVELHPLRGRAVSPRLAAGIASAQHSVHYSRVYGTEDDSVIAATGGVGVDFRITPRFLLGAEMLYIPFEGKPRDRSSAAIHPLTTAVSARFRW